MKTVDGRALAAQAPGHASGAAPTATSAAPRTVPVTALDGLLLSRDQIVAVSGGADMSLVNTINNTSDSAQLIDDRACLGLASVGDVTVYSDSGWVGMRGNQFSTPNAVLADATQLASSYTAARDAGGLLQRAGQDWQGCANKRFGFHSSNGNHSHFDTGPLSATDTRIALTMRQVEDARWACSHGLAVQSNIVIEARVCLLNKDTAAAVNNLLDQVVAKIPQ